MNFKTIARLSGALSAIALATAAVAAAPTSTTVGGKPEFGTFGVDLSAEDTSVKPGDDFWAYANGTWDKNTQIAPDRTQAGPFVTLADRAEAQVHDILTDLAANPGKYGPSGKQIGDFYASWMDEPGIEARGTAPLKPYLAKIAAVKDRAGIETLFAETGYSSPVDLDIIPDFADPTRYTAVAGQSGLGMARDNYLLPGA
jgi:endothelin-converting enzyme/putative endopeptidase